MQRITIDPITRLEGHGKIEIFLNEDGEVANTYFQIPELRGFERFCLGRPVEEKRAIHLAISSVAGDEVVSDLEAELHKGNWFAGGPDDQRRSIARILTVMTERQRAAVTVDGGAE